MESPLTSLTLYSLAIVLASFLGGLIPILRDWRKAHLNAFVSFGAGVLMGAAFLHMIPEAAELIAGKVGQAALIGMLTFYLLGRFIMIDPCHEGDCEYHHIGVPAFIGFSFHALTDGIALGASMFVPKLTPFVFMALISHRVPTSFAFTSILKVSRYSTKKIFVLLLFFAAMVPVGATLSYTALAGLTNAATGWAIGISAGSFLHIATSDLLPEVHRTEDHRWKNVLCFLSGLGLMILLSFFLHG